jgi:hypothetical protein
MAAVFDVAWDYGGSDGTPLTTSETFSNLRFKVADNNTQDTANPTPIPAAGTNYSYWKQLYIQCTTAPDTQVDNVEIFCDGTIFDAGAAIFISTAFPTKNSGSTAGYEVADTTDNMFDGTANHTLVTGETDIENYVTGSALSVTISEASSIIDAVGETTNYVVLQLNVASTATPGLKGSGGSETITWRYDEI